MYLSYSGWKKYTDCAFLYWLSYVAGIDPPGVDDRLGSIYGSSVGKLFEDFFNEELYRRPGSEQVVLSRVDSTVASVIKRETSPNRGRPGGVLLWKGKGPGHNPKGMYPNVDALKADVRDGVSLGFRIIRFYRLLGAGARAEVKLDSVISGHMIGGRADFIMVRVKPHGDEIILDGKGSKWREAYTDRKQLLWYALLFRAKNGRLPDNLGFVFWRYPPPKSVDWVEVREKEIDALQDQVLEDVAQIEKDVERLQGAPLTRARQVFLPIAGREGEDPERAINACRFCSYAIDEICPEGAKVNAARKSV